MFRDCVSQFVRSRIGLVSDTSQLYIGTSGQENCYVLLAFCSGISYLQTLIIRLRMNCEWIAISSWEMSILKRTSVMNGTRHVSVSVIQLAVLLATGWLYSLIQ